jgi:hypothetical protein
MNSGFVYDSYDVLNTSKQAPKRVANDINTQQLSVTLQNKKMWAYF